MRIKATLTILLACVFAWTGCEKKKAARGKATPGKQKTAAADYASDAQMIASFEKELAALDDAIGKGPATVAQYSRRGDLRMFLGKFEEAVPDYEQMVELDPTQEAKHWRLGIAYYLSGDFEKSAKQFETYYQNDKTDRETGLWHFLAVAGMDSIVGAQSRMLKFEEKDRDPFPQIYELYLGRINAEEFFRELYDAGFSTKPDAMFFARLYAGIFEEINGRAEPAAKYLRMAHESPWGRAATGGPGYMWQIARLLATASPAAETPAEEKKEGEKKADTEKK
jgi:lipoprotein NlpI